MPQRSLALSSLLQTRVRLSTELTSEGIHRVSVWAGGRHTWPLQDSPASHYLVTLSNLMFRDLVMSWVGLLQGPGILFKRQIGCKWLRQEYFSFPIYRFFKNTWRGQHPSLIYLYLAFNVLLLMGPRDPSWSLGSSCLSMSLLTFPPWIKDLGPWNTI